MIMVDEFMQWPHARGMFSDGASHLATDGHVSELHEFAARAGFKRHFFHNVKIMPHYDLTAEMRAHAIALGAVEVGWREQAVARRAKREAAKAQGGSR